MESIYEYNIFSEAYHIPFLGNAEETYETYTDVFLMDCIQTHMSNKLGEEVELKLSIVIIH